MLTELSLRQAPAVHLLRTHHEHAHDRRAVETLISASYAVNYGATVVGWAPMLVSLAVDGRMCAAAGYRGADRPLFLEQYLAAPIEEILSEQHGTPITRARVVEVGHLASIQHGAGRRLIRVLAQHLAACGYQWVVLTATRELRLMLARMGARFVTLADADPRLLGPEAAARWGTYYAHAPAVIAGELLPNLRRFRRRMDI